METRNYTPFPSQSFISTAKNGEQFYTVVTKATFDIRSGAPLLPAVKQLPLAMVDEFYGEMNQSSLRRESDLSPVKPGCDIYFVDPVAYAPGGQPAESWLVEVHVGQARKQIRVCGPRSWSYQSLSGWRLSRPEPVTMVPIRYELAFGGYWVEDEKSEVHRENLVGCGLVNMRTVDRSSVLAAPQLEDPHDPIDQLGSAYRSVGLGPVNKTWLPRVDKCGTYDKRWLETRWPVPPSDFDPAFYNCAPSGLISPTPLVGNETVVTYGLSPDGLLAFQLPDIRTVLFLRYLSGMMHPFESLLDTVIINFQQRTVELVWRGYAPTTPGVRVCEIRMLQNASRVRRGA